MKISEHEKIQKLVKMMRKQGILHLKTAEIEISLDPKHLPKEQKTRRVVSVPEDLKENFKFPVELSDEDMLMWSAPQVFHEEQPTTEGE